MTRYALKDKDGNPTVIPIETLAADMSKQPITTAALEVSIRRISDNNYYTGSGWQVAEIFLTMNAVSVPNAPGWWIYFLDTANIPPDTFFYRIIDTSGNAKNMPQRGEDILGDGLAKEIEIAASAGIGRVEYDETTSVLTLYHWADPAVIVKQFDMKDIGGDPAGEQSFFEKVQK